MSTRSELYHCFGLGVVEVTRVDHVGGQMVFHARHPKERIVCPACGSGDVVCQGLVERPLRLPPIGSRKVEVCFAVQRVQCRVAIGVSPIR
jgi:hypothetical protein